jgi:hypothetical protein
VPEERNVKKIYKWKLIDSIPVGRPNIRWMDNVMIDIQAVKIGNRERFVQNRNRWKSIVEEAKTRIEL